MITLVLYTQMMTSHFDMRKCVVGRARCEASGNIGDGIKGESTVAAGGRQGQWCRGVAVDGAMYARATHS